MKAEQVNGNEQPTADLLPLAVLAAELSTTVVELAARLDGIVVVDDIGVRCVPREVARRLIAERAEAAAQARVVQERNAAKSEALQRELHASISRGVAPPAGLESVSALDVMTADSKLDRLDEAAERFDEMFSGDSHYHPIRDES